ncbi:hypothetical protein [Roseibium sp.]|uniref:hypothetical protein n=1 Tax=Roseibium sp. TaxID=1936156 RepID=UPI003A9692D2
MSSRYPFDPFSRPDRPDIPLNCSSRRADAMTLGVRQQLLRLFRVICLWGLATLALSILFFLPVLVGEIGRVETVGLGGRTYTAQAFVDRLSVLFLGSVIIAAAVIGFIGSAALASRRLDGYTPSDRGFVRAKPELTDGELHRLRFEESFDV